jgi:hypothetical protein
MEEVMKKQNIVNIIAGCIFVLVFAFACYLLDDATNLVFDIKELVISLIFLALCFFGFYLLKHRKLALISSCIIILLFGGYIYFKYEHLHSRSIGILCMGGMVFQPSSGVFKQNAICYSPLRSPHWYESGVEVDFGVRLDFAAGNPGDLNVVAEKALIKSGAAKLVSKDADYEWYRVKIPRKLFSEWK